MKKYKLIKQYPHSGKLGITVTLADNELIYVQDAVCSNNYAKHAVEEFPEFWEEIKEIQLDYEILEFKSRDGYYSRKLINNFHIFDADTNPTSSHESKYLSDSTKWSIHKIKRLSDSQEFQIGDKVCWDWLETDCDYFTIKDFIINTEDYYKHTIGLNLKFSDSDRVNLFPAVLSSKSANLRIYEEPEILFTTEDNQPVYVNTKVYGVTSTLEHYPYNFKWGEGTFNKDTSFIFGMKYFSTKEAAQKYIDSKNEEKLLDSKCLSINEVLDVLESKGLYVQKGALNKLKELVKSKQ